MADAAIEERWTHTASILAMLANVNRAPSSRPVGPMDFMPERFKPEAPPEPITLLRDLFVRPPAGGSAASSQP